MSIKGIDVASYQHPNGKDIDWEKAHNDGIRFVFVKATEGVDYTNPYLRRDLHGAARAGIAVGVYHFVRPEHDAVNQANHFLKAVEDAEIHIDLPYAIDIETNDGLNNKTVHHKLDTIRTVLRQHGKRTITYSYGYFLENVVPDDCDFCRKDQLWLAAYQSTQPKPPKPWTKIRVWQKSSSADVAGVPSAKEDLDVFVGDADAFKVFIGKAEPAATVPDWYHRRLQFPPSNLSHPGHTVVRSGTRFQEGDDVKHVQRKLGIRVDGLYGWVTESHVKGFQRLHKIQPTGIVDRETAKVLG